MISMWEERIPKYGETVKVEFAAWTRLGTKIGVHVGFCNQRHKINFGHIIRFFDPHSTFFILKKV